MSVHVSSACKKLDYTGAKREVLLEFADHANDDGICWPSRARIMYNTGLSESAVKHAIRELKDAKVIVVVDHDKGGRGHCPVVEVHPEKGPQKIPFKEWWEKNLKGSKGSSDDRQRGQSVTPEPSGEPSSKEMFVEDKSSTHVGARSDDHKPDDGEKPMEIGQYLVKYTYDVIAEFRNTGKNPAPHDPNEIRKTGRIAKQAVLDDVVTVEESERAITRQVERACGLWGKKAWVGFHTALDEIAAEDEFYRNGDDGRKEQERKRRREGYEWLFGE